MLKPWNKTIFIMYKIHLLFPILLILLFANSCNTTSSQAEEVHYQCPMKCEGEKTYNEPRSCPVCKMDLLKLENEAATHIHEEDKILETSIFNLTSTWNTQNNQSIELKDLKGDVLVMVMIYTSCQSACPRLMADMRNIYGEIEDKSIKYVLISIDPTTDTPKRLREVAIENQMDNEQWIFLQGTEESVREFANVLAVKYKKITPLDFSHSNIISVFDKDGVLYHQQEGLGVDNKETVAKIKELIK